MYYLLYGFLFLLSLLPLRVLYLLSDFAYFVVYHVAGYRKDVVMNNLAIAFPEKSEQQRIAIAKKFYRNFTDNFIETIKLISAGESFLRKHFKGDTHLFDELFAQGRRCQGHMGHNFNWEMANLAMAMYTPYTLLTVYMPVNNKPVDRLLQKIRKRTGAVLLPATQMSTAILPWRDKQYLLALVADQSPGSPARAYWLNFFGRPTPFVRGPEKGAKANDTAVVFVHITKPKRGYYQMHAELATAHPDQLAEGELTKKYISYLQKVIRDQPEMWLWSHRRWKHSWKPGYPEVMA